MTSPAPPVLVIGLGNAMRRDDGIGPAAIELLERETLPAADMIVLDGESTRLIEAWRGRSRAIVIDAVAAGSRAGTIHEVEVGTDALPDWDAGASTHGAGIAEAVALGRALDRLPAELVVFGVEPDDLSHGPGLSPAVDAALPLLVERVRRRVEA